MEANFARTQLQELHRESFAWSLVCCRGDRTESEDVLQTTYLKVLDGTARHRGLGEFKPWLFAVIRRTAAGRRRTSMLRRLRLVADPTPPNQASAVVNPELEAVLNDEARRIRETLSCLSKRQRETLELVFYHGVSLREAAGVMGVTVGAARTHYHRGKQRLLARLEKGDSPCPTTASESCSAS